MEIRERILAVLVLVWAAAPAAAQTTAFADDFNRSSLTVGAPASYTPVVTAGDGGAGVVSGSFLQLTNDATAAANAAGRVFVTGPTTGFAGGYDPTLSANAGKFVEWTVNTKYNPTAQSGGFANGKPALAVVLAATGADLTTASGYALAIGHNGKSDRMQLFRFTGGLVADANLTAVVAAPTANLAGISNYASSRVRFDPASGQWSLYVRDDGASAWSDPSAGVTNLIGQAVDTTYTTSSLPTFGYFWNHGSAGTQTAQYDNYSVTLTPVPEPATVVGVAAVGLAGAFLGRLRRRYR